MTAYELMVRTNHYLIKGGELTDSQKKNIVCQFLGARNLPEQVRRFYLGVKFPNNTDAAGRHMYPMFFIPPYNGGKKHKTILNQTPQTHIFSSNMYELEILRLLSLLWPTHTDIRDMTKKTLERLKTTCFGYGDDGVGECFDTSLVVLRYLATAAPEEAVWMRSRMDNYNRHYFDKKRPFFCMWYYWLCLSELPFEIAKPELDTYKNEMTNWLCKKSCVMRSESDKVIHPVLFSILRNNLAHYPEYAYIKDRRPYVSPVDGRLHFDMAKEM